MLYQVRRENKWLFNYFTDTNASALNCILKKNSTSHAKWLSKFQTI